MPPSRTVTTVEDALAFSDEVIGLPVVIRPAFTLGGTGGGIARTRAELERIAGSGLAASPIGQILVEQYLRGWKEIEYEVMRDGADTCITVCNMENFDPLGIHTGDSIVVAPSQTLSDREYQMLRTAAIRIIRALGVEGGCNIQFALDPHSFRFYVIEVNPRVSRSSALASKATGYPIARVAAKIAIGLRLDEIGNEVTGKTVAAFEPALDYVVVKIPRWPFDKFPLADRALGTQMKATGEVMAIDRTFEAALQKAMRALELRADALQTPSARRGWRARWRQRISSERRAPLEPARRAALRYRDGAHRSVACRDGYRSLVPREAAQHRAHGAAARRARADARDCCAPPSGWASPTRRLRACARPQNKGDAADQPPIFARSGERWGILPTYKMVDTCAAEFAAETPYFYAPTSRRTRPSRCQARRR